MQRQLGRHGHGAMAPVQLRRPGATARRPALAPIVTAIAAPPRPSGQVEVRPLGTAAMTALQGMPKDALSASVSARCPEGRAVSHRSSR